jgi:hypothetical protein
MGQAGFQPSPRPMGPPSGLPPQLQGTGGVRSPAGPYGPPGFIGGLPGSLPVGSAQPLNPGSGTTGGVGTTMQPNTGGLDPNPANGPRLPPIPPGTPPFLADNWAFMHQTPQWPQAGTPEWFNSQQGMNAQRDMAMRLGNNVLPGSMNGSNFTGAHPSDRNYRSNAGEGYQSPMSGMTRQQASAQSQSNWANPDWRMQQVLAGKIAPTNAAEGQAMLANMTPEARQAYIDKYKSIGLDPTYQGGGGTGPFGN